MNPGQLSYRYCQVLRVGRCQCSIYDKWTGKGFEVVTERNVISDAVEEKSFKYF